MYKDPGKKFLSDLKLYSDYLKWDSDKNRYETWEEAMDEILAQHRLKYKGKDVEQELDYIRPFLYNRKILASQRNLQFRAAEIFKHNSRLFNCSSTYIDRPEVFKQIMYLLLSGCGVGFSVQKRHIVKLPSIKKRSNQTITYVVPDSIEGWSLALDELMMSYFNGTEKIRFDYSLIRPKNSLIANRFLAPGHEPLKRSIEIIEGLIDSYLGDNTETKLHSVIVYDIICHASDAVLAAGLRRSALICLFDKDDEGMINSKTGDWYITHPQRGRSNNSAVLVRGEYTEEEYQFFAQRIKEFGEPGFLIVDDDRFCTNPCQPKWATVLTPKGIRTLGDVSIGDKIWSEEGWTTVINKWSTGIKDVFSYKTTGGEFVGTEDHRLVSNGIKEKAKYCDSIDILEGSVASVRHNAQTIMDGLVLGDGGIHKASNDLIILYIGDNDKDYFTSEVGRFILKERLGISQYAYEIQTTISSEELPAMHERVIPKRYFEGNSDEAASLLRGLYSANGSVVRNRITYKTSSPILRDQIQLLLSSLGIKSYFTTNKTKDIKFVNGVYTCKESYDINVSADRDKFVTLIGFLQKYKNEKINTAVKGGSKISYPISSVNYISTEEVFDITVDNSSHTYWTGGVNVSNCAEISFIPINPFNGNSCISFCNLNEISAKGINSLEEFLGRVKAAVLLGTMQCGYTEFPFLGKDTEELVSWESLLGISITGWFDNPELFNEDWLQKGAAYAKEVNAELAAKLGLNASARMTCVKPSGNASVILGTASGIHPAHSRNYFRIMQLNKDNEVCKWLKENRPDMLEDSVWSANNTDYAVYVPITEDDGAIFKSDISGIAFLDKVKLVQQNWVIPGTNKDLGYSKSITHNVSNTVLVDDWEETFEYVHKNNKYFCGISFIPNTGDKDYKQAPFTSVLMAEELLEKYGNASIFASGLIVDGLHYFNGDLWRACDHIINRSLLFKGSRDECLLQKDWVRRAKKFAKNYFKGSIENTIYCLKDVHLFHKWNIVKRDFKPVDFSEILTEPTYQDVSDYAAIACSGGSCEI